MYIELGTNHAPSESTKVDLKKSVPTKPHESQVGRKTVMTPDTIAKLEDAFMNSFTDRMACLYAGIDEATLYRYCEANPKFSERKEILKDTPNLAAQNELVKGIKGNVSQARWWAEHRMPEFMPKTKVEHGGKIDTTGLPMTEAVRKVATEYEEKLRQAIVEGGQKKP